MYVVNPNLSERSRSCRWSVAREAITPCLSQRPAITTVKTNILPRSPAGRRCRVCTACLSPDSPAAALPPARAPWTPPPAAVPPASDVKDVVHQQLAVIAFISLERWRSRPGENPVVVLPLEQSRRHRRPRTDRLRIDNPALHPVGLQTLLCQQEVGCGRDLVVMRIAGCVALQARRRRAENRLRAMSVSLVGKTGTCSGM